MKEAIKSLAKNVEDLAEAIEDLKAALITNKVIAPADLKKPNLAKQVKSRVSKVPWNLG